MALVTTGIGNGVNPITSEYPVSYGGSFRASIAICQLASFLARKYQIHHKKVPVASESNKIQLKRLPLAYIDFYRILSTDPDHCHSLNVAEEVFACIYILSPLTKECVNCDNRQ